MQIEPGIYYDIPFEEYKTWDAVSNSKLNLAAKSAAHYKQGFGDKTTPALRMGSLTHCGVLEPDQLGKRYVVEPDFASMPENVDAKGNRSFSSATTFVKEVRRSFAQYHDRKQIVTQAEYDRVVGVANSLARKEKVRELLSHGNAEVSLAWTDVATGLACKCRIDWLQVTDDLVRIVDLKTCRDARKFQSSIADYGYHRQMAFYVRGIEAIMGIRRIETHLIAVETEAPYCSRTAPLAVTALRHGGIEIDGLLELVASCKALGAWPGYDDPTEWELPAWVTRKNDDELVEIGDDI